MEKIIFINRYFYPDQSATSQILSDLVFNIVQDIDADIHVITSRNTYQNNRRLDSDEIVNNIKIHRVWSSRFGRKNLLGRLIDYLSFYITTFYMLMRITSKDDVVVAKTDPPVISYVALLVCKFKRAHLINWLQDLFPEVAGKLGLIKENGILFKIIKALKDKTLVNARANVVIGVKMRERLKGMGVLEEKIRVISNWNINKNINYIKKESNLLIGEWGLEGKFVIGYSGNYGRAHEYDVIHDLINEYRLKDEFVFLFIGGGKYYDDLKYYVENENIKNVLFKPYQPLQVLDMSLSVPDLHLVSLRPGLEGLIVPSKFFGLASIGANLLFIGDCGGELGSLIKKYKCGCCYDGGDGVSLAAQIMDIKNNPGELIQYGENLKSLYLEKYQPVNAYDAWVEVLQENKV
ncbi:Glycosyltransferase [hydrothermal vent metagenome]|uniref:Glycosyltransferase n=1 Tax=hydrothermal vent metagenome TaxID=652676 RepID=A0A3B0XGZ6_9ZZZZ